MRSQPETRRGNDPDRAVAVPFDAERLLGARVRPDGSTDKAALLHDFSGAGSTYVLPWADLPKCMRLAPFDEALHAEVAALAFCTPATIRGALAIVCTPELATPERLATMRRQRGIDEDRRIELAMSVIARLLRPLSARFEDLDALVYSHARDRGVAALRRACARHGISADRFTDIHGELVSELMPVGLPGPPGQQSGALRFLNDELAQLGRALQRRTQNSTDNTDPLRRIMDAAKVAVADAAEPLSSIGSLTADLWSVFAHWNEVRPRMRGMVTDLDWCLDGWPGVLQLIADAACAPGDVRQAALARAALIAERLRQRS